MMFYRRTRHKNPLLCLSVLIVQLLMANLAYSQAASTSVADSLPAVSQPVNAQGAIAPPTLQLAAREDTAQLLEWLGVLPAVRQVPQVAEMSLRGQLLNVPATGSLQQLQDTVQQQYADTDLLQASVIDFVAARIDSRAIARAKNLLQQSLPVAVRNSDKLMQQSSAVAEMNEYHRKLGMQPAVNSRKALVVEIDKILRISLLAVQIQTSIDQAVNVRLAGENHIAAAAENLLAQKLATREAFMQQRVRDLLLFVYKDIRASELREYVVLMSDDSIQKLLDLSQQAIEVSLRNE